MLGVAALLLVYSVAIAGPALPQPKAGAWKFGDADGGFTLAAGKGHKLFLTNVHSRTQNFVGCPEKSEPITVSGRFPLRVIKLQEDGAALRRDASAPMPGDVLNGLSSVQQMGRVVDPHVKIG